MSLSFTLSKPVAAVNLAPVCDYVWYPIFLFISFVTCMRQNSPYLYFVFFSLGSCLHRQRNSKFRPSCLCMCLAYQPSTSTKTEHCGRAGASQQLQVVACGPDVVVRPSSCSSWQGRQFLTSVLHVFNSLWMLMCLCINVCNELWWPMFFAGWKGRTNASACKCVV